MKQSNDVTGDPTHIPAGINAEPHAPYQELSPPVLSFTATQSSSVSF